MPTVVRRNVDNKLILNYAVCKFLSRIIIKILPRSSLDAFRKVEKISKKISKLKADLKYLKFCSTNQLLPKFVNFQLYDVSATHEPETIDFKNKLLVREMGKKESELEELGRISLKDKLF